MGPGPVDVYPRVLRALSTPMLGQFDPEFTNYMNETMALYRSVYRDREPMDHVYRWNCAGRYRGVPGLIGGIW